MERTTWTDERLDDLSRTMAAGFERVDQDIRDLRGDIGSLSTELRGEIDGLRVTLIRVGGGIMAGLVGVIAAVLVGS